MKKRQKGLERVLLADLQQQQQIREKFLQKEIKSQQNILQQEEIKKI